MNLILLGPPGAGKGSQAKKVCKKYNIPHISTGDMFRKAISQGTKMGMVAKSHIDDGNLVPDDIVIGIVRDRLEESDCEKGYLLDGFPRTIAQAEALAGFSNIDMVILVDVADEVLIKRLSRRRACKDCSAPYDIKVVPDGKCPLCGGEMIQRSDDSEETVKTRLKVYHEKTSPLIDYYQNHGLLCKIDGDAEIEAVFNAICDVLDGV